MTESVFIKTELLSYLATKVEYCSSECHFKAKNLQFTGRTPQAIGRICGILVADGLIVKINRRHTPSVWLTNLMEQNGGEKIGQPDAV